MRAMSVFVAVFVSSAVLLVGYAPPDLPTLSAAPSPQTTPAPGPDQSSGGLAFHLDVPASWAVEVFSPYEAEFTQEDVGGIFVTRFEDVESDSPVDDLLVLAMHELRREFVGFAQVHPPFGDALGGELHGWPATQAFFEANLQGEERLVGVARSAVLALRVRVLLGRRSISLRGAARGHFSRRNTGGGPRSDG